METAYAEHGGAIEPNIGRNHPRPKNLTIFFKNCSILRIQTKETIKGNKPTMCIRNYLS